ncbi:MAG: DUF2283 domain-containing protein [Myxococcota bacterium]
MSFSNDERPPIRLVTSPDDPGVAYLYLRDHPGPGAPGISVKQVRLRDVIQDYSGPDLIVDFDADGRAIGVEVLGW